MPKAWQARTESQAVTTFFADTRRRALPAMFAAAALVSGCGKDDSAPAVTHGLATAVAGHVTPAGDELGTEGPEASGGKLLFAIAADAKAMTAVIAARLIERGLIRWDTRLAEALPELRRDMLPAYRNATLEDLLAHRAGVAPFTTEGELRRFVSLLPAQPEARP